ncbi:MAG: DUF58 domain-containing protein [Candidatus Dadabacteria bacterium]|nr:MAG: DUF58 domain-containing protein [Candidatus Dadabacteria bacterium]
MTVAQTFTPDSALLAELKRIELRTRRTVSSDFAGRYRSAFRGRGLILSDLREYQPGDDVRDIHWKATARTNRVFVKTYEEDRQLNIIVAIDISRSTLFGGLKTKHSHALDFAALMTILAASNNDCIGLCLFAGQVEEYYPPRQRRGWANRILYSLLSQKELPATTDIAKAAQYISRHQKRPAIIFFISDFYSKPFKEEFKALGYKHDLICVNLKSELEVNPPAAGLVEFTDAETGERYMIDTSSKKVAKELRQAHARHLLNLQNICKEAKAELITIRDNPIRPLQELMLKRTRRFHR